MEIENMNLDPETDLTLTKALRSPRSKLWECWTTPKHIKHFFVPKPHKISACDIDLRIGGRFNTTFEVNDAKIENFGVILEIVEQRKLVITDSYLEGWKPAPNPFVTGMVLFEDGKDGGTNYIAVARHRTVDDRKKHEDMGFHEGWGTVADQLDEYASSLP